MDTHFAVLCKYIVKTFGASFMSVGRSLKTDYSNTCCYEWFPYINLPLEFIGQSKILFKKYHTQNLIKMIDYVRKST